MKTRSILFYTAVGLHSLLFCYAAVSKLMDYELFRSQMVLLPLVGRWGGLLAVLLIGFELMIVILLLLSKYKRTGLWLSSVSLLAFSVYIGAVLISGIKKPCTCGGLLQSLTWQEHIALNLSLAILGLTALLCQPKIRLPKAL